MSHLLRRIHPSRKNASIPNSYGERAHPRIGGAARLKSIHTNQIGTDQINAPLVTQGDLLPVSLLIRAYREHGHRMSRLDPLGLQLPVASKLIELKPETYGLTEDLSISAANELLPLSNVSTVKEMVKFLDSTYCGGITMETAHISDITERDWFIRTFEMEGLKVLTESQQKRTVELLAKSQAFDHFLAKKFQHVKRYGAEGAESMLPFVEEVLKSFRKNVSGECTTVIAMPHRGRLNVLTCLLDFPLTAMFSKMKGNSEHAKELPSSGDVMSHLRSSVDIDVIDCNESLHVSLLPNPSHLEAINPVAIGNIRGRKKDQNQILSLQLHGDASFSAQGIVAETFAMSNLPGFSVGGTIHLVVNNQLGFTTPGSKGRSSLYCTDIGKMTGCPIIHVNGENPEDVVRAARVATSYWKRFHKDVIVDMVCYRRWGHNELDDASMTQPLMYKAIESSPSIPNRYASRVGCSELAEEIQQKYSEYLNHCLKETDHYQSQEGHLKGYWSNMNWASGTELTSWDTGCNMDLLKYVGGKSCESSVSVHAKVAKILEERRKRLEEGTSLDWATAEALAVGSMLMQGFGVRLSGQDVGRGTFSHRHFSVTDQADESIDIPLNRLSPQQGSLEVVNSLLSEEAVLGFEYGHSLCSPNQLVIWEAQFGDFFNGAQVIIDTFISSGEAKWLLQSGLVMLLPHGYDGAGPEHSSCRLERFLQMTNSGVDAPDSDSVNMWIVNPTTPAQYFHLLRQQVIRNFRKPLIVASPKTLLRLPSAVSSLSDMSPGTSFQHVLPDRAADGIASEIKKVLLCSGKHFYALDSYRKAQGIKDTAIVRIECLCPFPSGYINLALKNFKNAKDFVWCQEEHQNMGPWSYVEPRLRNQLGLQLKYAGRGPAALPAVGIAQTHKMEADEIVKKAFK